MPSSPILNQKGVADCMTLTAQYFSVWLDWAAACAGGRWRGEMERSPGLERELGVSHGNDVRYTLLVLLGGEGSPVTVNLYEAAH